MSYRKIILILCLGIFLSAGRSANAQSVATFKYVSNGVQTWTVPGCVTQVTVEMWGGGGGSGNYYCDNDGYEAGGSGGYLEVLLTGLTSGQVLTLTVPSGGKYQSTCSSGQTGGLGGWPGGGNGGDDNNYEEYGGGGGGYAALQINGTYYAICGGGGGGGSYCCYYANGGGGGSATGGAGSNDYGVGQGGTGGTQTQGGNCQHNLCSCDTMPSNLYTTRGSYLQGGYGGGHGSCYCYYYGGGGGGGGYYGGGGGGDFWGGGGGGSSFPANNNSTFKSNGITCTVLSTIIGTQGTGAQNYVAPGNPAAGIGSGGYLSNGGNGSVLIHYTSDTITSLQATAVTNIVCNGNATGVATVGVNNAPGGSAFTYLWKPGGQSTDTITGLFAGTYTVTVIGCVTATATVTISQPPFFGPTPTINQIQCNGGTGSIYAGATGGTPPYTYLFTPGGQVPSIANLGVGTYSLNIIDSKGCATSDQITITQPSALTISANLVDSVVCNGQSNGSAVANVSGGTYPYAYSWSPAGGNNAIATGLAGGNYVVTATDAHGCSISGNVSVYQPKPLDVLLTPPLLNLACNGDNNGVLSSGVTGGTRPYTYMWSNNLGVDSNATGLSAGTYTLTVTDMHHCVTVATSTITQPSPLVVTIDTTFNSGSCNGTAWVTLNGGVQPYTYLWSNGSKSYYQSNLCSGLYCCTVTDANGCLTNICAHIASDLGVDNLSTNSAKISVYPNPNNGMFTIQSSVGNGQLTVEVYNVLGEKVYSQSDIQNSTLSVNLGSQPNGVYLYRVLSSTNGTLLGEGKVVIEK